MNMHEKLMKRTLESLNVEDVENAESAFSIVIDSIAMISKDTNIHSLKELIATIDFSLLKSISTLDEKDFSKIEKLVEERSATINGKKIYLNQIQVQRLINPSKRKKLAAYYTKPIGLDLMRQIITRHSKIYDSPLTLSDPFLGSGLTLSEIAGSIPNKKIRKIWGIEPHPLSALVAYSAILHVVKGDMQKVQVLVGDSFKLVFYDLPSILSFGKDVNRNLLKANVILTNPPFTRWGLLDKQTRIFLTNLVDRLPYRKYVERKQMNLQVLSLFLMDYFLEKNGLLISVLPASTFYTIYGEAAKKMFNDKYQIYSIVEYKHGPSFSMDSGFKELIIIASKRKPFRETAFITLDDNGEILKKLPNILEGERLFEKSVNWVYTYQIPPPWNNNWLTLFGQNEVRNQLSKIFAKAFEKGVVDFWADSSKRKNIVRGVEMYGPNFFFIPNKYWKIVEENAENIVIENPLEKRKLRISREYLTHALRRPALYTNSLMPSVNHYLVSIPPKDPNELPKDLAYYIKWGYDSKAANPAIRAFGEFWYSHVYRQLQVKRPFGRVFLPDKIDPSFKKRGVFCCYSKDLLTASKNFYIVSFSDELVDKAIAAWFNSTIFIAYFVVASRKITERWTRFLEEDYLRMPIIKVESLNYKDLDILNNCFDKLARIKLPSIKSQIGKKYRKQLDNTIFNALGIENKLQNKLYTALEKLFIEIELYS